MRSTCQWPWCLNDKSIRLEPFAEVHCERGYMLPSLEVSEESTVCLAVRQRVAPASLFFTSVLDGGGCP